MYSIFSFPLSPSDCTAFFALLPTFCLVLIIKVTALLGTLFHLLEPRLISTVSHNLCVCVRALNTDIYIHISFRTRFLFITYMLSGDAQCMCIERKDGLGVRIQSPGLLLDLGQNLRVPEEEVFLVAKLDRASAPPWKENFVSRFDRGRDDLSVLIRRTGSNSNHSSLGQGAGRRRLGEEDPGSSFCIRLEPLNQNTVEEWYDSLNAFESHLGSH